MSGKGPQLNSSQSKYTKPMQEAYDQTIGKNTSDDQFKKTTQVVGKPGITEQEDYIKNPPQNLPGDPVGDDTRGKYQEPDAPQADTVSAKSLEEIQKRIDGDSK